MRVVGSLLMRSPTPVNTAVPPESTMLPYRSFRMSTSHVMMDWKVVPRMPLASLSVEAGLEKHLGATEAFAADSNGIAFWPLVGDLLVGDLGCLLPFDCQRPRRLALFLFDVPDG